MSHRSSTARIKAVYPQSSVHFEIAADTPVEQLCALVGSLGKGHGDLLLIEVSLPTLDFPERER
jgi:hypothetical protein